MSVVDSRVAPVEAGRVFSFSYPARRRRWLLAATALSVVFSLAGAVVIPGPSAAATTAATTEPAVPLAAGACPASRAEDAEASVAAKACGSRVLVTSRLSETSAVWAEADGSLTAEVSSGIVRVRDGADVWRDVDLTLERRPDGTVASKVHPVGVVLSGAATSAGEHDLVILGSGDKQTAVGWRGRLPEPVLEGTKATYAEVKPGVDLVIEVTRTGYESFLIVKNRAAAAQVASVAMPWRSSTLSARKLAGRNAMELVDAKGTMVGAMADAYMWDSRVNPQTGLPLKRVPVGLGTRAVGAGKTDLVLTPDAAFLSDPSTQFPVIIDPQENIGQTQDTWVQCAWNSSLQTCVGNGVGWNSVELLLGTWNDGGENARSFLSFNYAPYYGTYVNWATLGLYETWAWSCTDTEWQIWTTGFFDHTTNWGNQPQWLVHRDSSWETTGYDSCESDGWVGIDATEWTQAAVDSAYIYWGLGLKAHQEWPNGSAADSWKRFRSSNSSYGQPVLTINFNVPPTVGGMATSPTLPCVTGTGAPHVTAIPQLQSLIHDSEADAVSAQYEWWLTDGAAPIGGTTTGPAAAGTWQPLATIPAADLPDGPRYSWRVRGYDGHKYSAWSGWCEFYLDSKTPTGMVTDPPTPCVFTPGGGGPTASLPRVHPNAPNLVLKARVDDVNGGVSQAEFEWYPKVSSTPMGSVITPALPVGSTFQATIPSGTFSENVAYSWRVRGYDGGYPKPWSQWCEFVVDTQRPGAPSVSAAPDNDLILAPAPGIPDDPLPTAVVGRPTRITFTPAGGSDSNIVGYLWGLNSSSPDRWAPAGPGGTAVVTVTIEPLQAGFTVNELTVLAVDRAGNRSLLPTGQTYTVGFKANPAAGWWPTKGTAGPSPDVTDFANDLTLASGTSSGYGTLTFNGSTSEAVTAAPVLDTTDSFTVSAWVRPTSLTTARTVVGQDGTSESGFRLMFRPTENRWCAVMAQSDSPAPALDQVCTSAAPTRGVWAHLVGVYNAGTQTLTLHLNGAAVGSVAVTSPWPAFGPFVVGRGLNGGVAGDRFNGDIADVRAWQFSLDPAGIAALAKLPPEAGRWGMDDPVADTAADLSGLAAAHPATLAGAAGYLAGHTGFGLVADGTSGRAATSTAVLKTNEAFTVSAWVRLSTKGTSSRAIVSQSGTTLSAFQLQWEANSDRWEFAMPSADGGSPTWTFVRSTAAPPTGTWVHLTAVYDKSAAKLRLYVNGVKQGSDVTAGTVWNATGALLIGDAKEPGQARWWAGDIDDVRVWRGALTQAQITTLAAS